jgi:hypothetical protein
LYSITPTYNGNNNDIVILTTIIIWFSSYKNVGDLEILDY